MSRLPSQKHLYSMLSYLSRHQEVPEELRFWIKTQLREPNNRFVLEAKEHSSMASYWKRLRDQRDEYGQP